MMRFLIIAASVTLLAGGLHAQGPGDTALSPAQQHQIAQQRAAQSQIAGSSQGTGPATGTGQAKAAGASSRQTQAATAAQAGGVPQAPFPELTAQQEQELTRLLQAWEAQSKTVERLEADFTRWHYDLTEAPAGIHSTWAKGELRYAAPDKGMFKVNELKFYKGIAQDKPQYEAIEGRFGEYWACNGKQLLDYDRGKKECTVQDLPPELQGTQIFESPLPFVFNLDAVKIRQRYWVRTVPSPKPDMIVVEAWPKRQEDRSQYRLVQIVIDPKTFLPHALLMYAPNYNTQTAPAWDHYEFSNVKKNSMIGGLQQFVNKFIEKPDRSWKIIQEHYQPAGEDAGQPLQSAQAPTEPTRQLK